MKTQELKNYILVTPDEELFIHFHTNFTKNNTSLENKHVIIDLLKYNAITAEDMLLFLDTAIKHKKNNTSFIIINATIDTDNLPETLQIAPTLLEAEDILEMEAIERELGF